MENKKYLNTVEEITKALSEGKVIYEVEAKNPEQKYFKHWIINGIVISKFIAGFSDYSTYIGRQFRVDADTIFYYEEKEQLKIEVGKFYKTRGGHKVICAYKSKQKTDAMPYFFSSVEKDELFSIWTTEYGHVLIGENSTNNKDIVDYWEDK